MFIAGLTANTTYEATTQLSGATRAVVVIAAVQTQVDQAQAALGSVNSAVLTGRHSEEPACPTRKRMLD